MKIAYFSPLTSDASGIADFSEELLLALKDHIEIDVFYREVPENPDIFWNFTCLPMEEFEREDIRKKYDLFVYQLGNNFTFHEKIMRYALKYPGIAEIHDCCMGDAMFSFCGSKENFLAWAERSDGKIVRDELEEWFEKGGTPIWQIDPWKMPMIKPFVDVSQGVIVHTERNMRRILQKSPKARITAIPLHAAEIVSSPAESKKAARKRLNLPENLKMFGSFGHAVAAKRISQILDVLGKYKALHPDQKFLYCIVGETVPGSGMEDQISRFNLSENVRITGFTDSETFRTYMKACDFCINLRYPSRGESSSSLHRMMGYGKQVLVTDVDNFADYPDGCTIKIPYGDQENEVLYRELENLLSGRTDYETNGMASWRYAKENLSLENNVNQYIRFFEKVLSANGAE